MEKKTLEDKKTDRRNKERELQDLEEKHQVEIKVYKQSVKHLLFEHQDETTVHKTGIELNTCLIPLSRSFALFLYLASHGGIGLLYSLTVPSYTTTNIYVPILELFFRARK